MVKMWGSLVQFEFLKQLIRLINMHNKLIKTDFSKIKDEKTQYKMIVSVSVTE